MAVDKELSPFQQEIVAERDHLEEKRKSIITSMYSGEPSSAELKRIARQILIMQLYSQVLEERIHEF